MIKGIEPLAFQSRVGMEPNHIANADNPRVIQYAMRKVVHEIWKEWRYGWTRRLRGGIIPARNHL